MYDVRRNRLLAARMRARCDGTVKMYRKRAWEVALAEERQRSTLQSIFFAISTWLMSQTRARGEI